MIDPTIRRICRKTKLESRVDLTGAAAVEPILKVNHGNKCCTMSVIQMRNSSMHVLQCTPGIKMITFVMRCVCVCNEVCVCRCGTMRLVTMKGH